MLSTENGIEVERAHTACKRALYFSCFLILCRILYLAVLDYERRQFGQLSERRGVIYPIIFEHKPRQLS